MQSAGRKRVVSSCIPCYTRKQKCNRRYPCNHCSRRRRPEECSYYASQVFQAHRSPPRVNRLEYHHNEREQVISDYYVQSQDCSTSKPAVQSQSNWNTTKQQSPTVGSSSNSFAESFGYFEHSEGNTIAFVRKLGLNVGQECNNQNLTTEALIETEQQMKRMPDRQICDFLVQYYIDEVHWKEQLVHPPWFLVQYQQLWDWGNMTTVFYVEFIVLVMRVCSYASQFLPSPSHPIDRIRGMVLSDIRTLCDDIAEKLSMICTQLDARGTLLRVQHLSFLGLRLQCEGRNLAFWEVLSKAALVAQRVGLHLNNKVNIPEMHGLEIEMRRRVFCNLYVWDSTLSRQLDRIPFLPTTLDHDNLPQMHLAPILDNENTPESFLERSLQARLAGFWAKFLPKLNAEYDVTAAEERYEQFCSEFLPVLPAVFTLEPSNQWDKQLRRLPFQRHILHIAIFESLCQNYRRLLLCGDAQIQALPVYKQVLLSSQKRALAVAALNVLDEVSKLHSKLGGSHTKFPGIVLPTFEAAVLLISVCKDTEFPAIGTNSPIHTGKIDPLGSGLLYLSRDRCIQATRDAVARLRTLAEVSNMAEEGANILLRLLNGEDTFNSPTSLPHVSGLSAESTASLPSSENVTQPQLATNERSSWMASVDTSSSLDLGMLNDFLFTP